MTTTLAANAREARYRGLRMAADEYLALPDDGFRYELVDGVVCKSPSPSWPHQRVVTEIAGQIWEYTSRRSVGEVAVEVDIFLGSDPVYRPNVVFLCAAKAAQCRERVGVVQDVIVEVVSPDSRRYDHETKKHDYEQAGVGEYWVIDPDLGVFTFHRLAGGRFVEASAGPARFTSQVIAGFELDLESLRKVFPAK